VDADGLEVEQLDSGHRGDVGSHIAGQSEVDDELGRGLWAVIGRADACGGNSRGAGDRERVDAHFGPAAGDQGRVDHAVVAQGAGNNDIGTGHLGGEIFGRNGVDGVRSGEAEGAQAAQAVSV
jgi:hypothetical protein